MVRKTVLLASATCQFLCLAAPSFAQTGQQALASQPQDPALPPADQQISPDQKPSPALAQKGQQTPTEEPAADQAAPQGSDIIVTASRSKEVLRRAPLAVTVLSQDELTKGGTNNVQTLATTAPSVQVGTVGFNNSTFVSIRGVSNTGGNPTVATYIDGVFAQTAGLASAFYDLDRLEVLRGPQGTLYGRASTGGNLNLYTAEPGTSFYAGGDISYGNYNDVQARVTVNLPVSDTLSLRFAGLVHRNDGYIDTNGATARNYARADDLGGRVTALWRPTEKFSWRVAADNFTTRGTPNKLQEIGSDGGFVTEGAPYHPVIVSYPEPKNNLDNLFLRSRMEYNFGPGIVLSYLAGYQKVSFETQFAWNGRGGILTSSGLTASKTTSDSNEVTLTFNRGPISNIAGVSVFNTSNTGGGAVYPIPAANILFGLIGNEGRLKGHGYGVFDQATLELRPGLKLIGGIRYSDEGVKIAPSRFVYCSPVGPFLNTDYNALLKNLATIAATNPTCLIAPNPVGESSSNKVSWKAGVTFDLSDDVSGYATATTGFRSGGFNPGSTTFLPESIINYEAGLKARGLGGRLNVNTAVFFNKYTNLQVISQSGVLNEVTNAASAHIKGLELEGRFTITPRDRISGFVTYLDAKFQEYPNAPDPLDNVVFASLKGNRLPYSPKYSARLSYAHDFLLENGGVLTASAIGYWQDDMFLRVFNRPIDRVNGYTKSNADLTYVGPDKHWSVSAFVDNIEGTVRRNSAYNSSGLYESEVNPPRTIGIRLRGQM